MNLTVSLGSRWSCGQSGCSLGSITFFILKAICVSHSNDTIMELAILFFGGDPAILLELALMTGLVLAVLVFFPL